LEGGPSSFELLCYLFANAPRQIVVVDYAPRLVVDYHVTGIVPATPGPTVMGDVLNFQPSDDLEKNKQAKKDQKNLAAAPGDKAPRSAPHLFQSLIVVRHVGSPTYQAHPVMRCSGYEVRRRGYIPKHPPDTAFSTVYISPSLTIRGIIGVNVRPNWAEAASVLKIGIWRIFLRQSEPDQSRVEIARGVKILPASAVKARVARPTGGLRSRRGA
jgi:hypothetical protein